MLMIWKTQVIPLLTSLAVFRDLAEGLKCKYIISNIRREHDWNPSWNSLLASSSEAEQTTCQRGRLVNYADSFAGVCIIELFSSRQSFLLTKELSLAKAESPSRQSKQLTLKGPEGATFTV